jgi:hypothetical protein
VLRYDGATPGVPTFYEASTESWDVVKNAPDGPHRARHPILEIRGATILLKDEGAADADAERWEATVEGDRLRVVARTGEHAGAVGIAERVGDDSR